MLIVAIVIRRGGNVLISMWSPHTQTLITSIQQTSLHENNVCDDTNMNGKLMVHITVRVIMTRCQTNGCEEDNNIGYCCDVT